MDTKGILIVEDERIIALDLRYKLARLGYEVAGLAHSGAEAVRMARDARPALVLMDIVLDDDMDGVEAARRIRLERDVPLLFVSACNDSPTRERALQIGCTRFVSKPVDPQELSKCIYEALNGMPSGCG
jgi:CheY-like chemotaxis protein